MFEIVSLENSIQHYAWGSRTAISALLRKPPSGRPEAELWIGAHPKCPSSFVSGGSCEPLPDWIARNPGDVLGSNVATKFAGRLPFLLKVLAARRPLSIHAHPNKTQAEEGFQRENQLGIPIAADRRNYRDDNHKPEIICALTDFWALKGFRPVEEIVADLQSIIAIEPEWSALRENQNSDGLREFFCRLMELDLARRQSLIGSLVEKAYARLNSPESMSVARPKDRHWYWIAKLDELYPDDIGVACVLMLRLVPLRPQEALYLPAGELHAYLEGTGIELMANSDNVLRGGLTSKHVDTPELLRTVNFLPQPAHVLTGVPSTPTQRIFPTPAREFELSVIQVDESQPHSSAAKNGVEILLVTQGAASIIALPNKQRLSLNQGSSVLVPAALPQYRIECPPGGKATLFKAAVP